MSAPRLDRGAGTWLFDLEGPRGRQREARGRDPAQGLHDGREAALAALRELERSLHTGRKVLPSRQTFRHVPRRTMAAGAVGGHQAETPAAPPTRRWPSTSLPVSATSQARSADRRRRQRASTRSCARVRQGRGNDPAGARHRVQEPQSGTAVAAAVVQPSRGCRRAGPVARGEPEAWSPSEVVRILQVCRDDRWWPLWRLAFTTGMRRGELCGLRWSSVDLDRAQLVVRHNHSVVRGRVVPTDPKGKRPRVLGLDPTTVDVLREWAKIQAAGTHRVCEPVARR